MWQSNISFCSSCSEEMPHHWRPTYYLPLLFCCVAGLYGFVPRVRLNRLNWPKVVKIGSQRRRKGTSWKWSPGSCHPGIPSLSFPLPLSDWEGFLQLLDPCLATDMPTAMSLYLRFLPQNVLCSITSIVDIVVFPFHVGSYSGYYYIIGNWSWLYKFMPTILQQKRCLFAQNAI